MAFFQQYGYLLLCLKIARTTFQFMAVLKSRGQHFILVEIWWGQDLRLERKPKLYDKKNICISFVVSLFTMVLVHWYKNHARLYSLRNALLSWNFKSVPYESETDPFFFCIFSSSLRVIFSFKKIKICPESFNLLFLYSQIGSYVVGI